MQRVGVAQALVCDPQLVILDEPTDGVDPVGRHEIRDLLLRLKTEGRTVFVNSHLHSELEMMCDRVAILVAGRVVSQGTLNELTVDRQCFEIEIAPPPGGDASPSVLYSNLASTDMQALWSTADKGKLREGNWIELENATLRVGTTDAARLQPVIDDALIRKTSPSPACSARPPLAGSTLFIEAVGGLAAGHNAGSLARCP